MKKEKIRKIWIAIQNKVGSVLLDLNIAKSIVWKCEHPWTVFFYKN